MALRAKRWNQPSIDVTAISGRCAHRPVFVRGCSVTSVTSHTTYTFLKVYIVGGMLRADPEFRELCVAIQTAVRRLRESGHFENESADA